MTRSLAFEPRLIGVSGLLFAASAATTIAWCASMSAMDMSMPGGWTMSMAWMRMPDQTWSGAAASFLGMWTVMMVAMMLPALVPTLRRYAAAWADTDGSPVGRRVAVAGAAYFSVWAAAGLALFPAGAALAAIEMDRPAVARAVPVAIAAVLLIAGAWQFSAAKARALACCGSALGHGPAATAGGRAAWRDGLRLGVQCLRCCGNLMAVLVAVGVMDLATMGLVTAAITAERVAPAGARAAGAIGVVLLAAGVVALVRAVGGA